MNDNLCISTLRCLALDMIDKANSGHPGMALGSAPILHTLYSRHLVSTAADSGWIKRDRFVLSSGHVSSLLYAMLHLTGYDISLDDLKSFRQLYSKTPGHPEYGYTPGVEVSTDLSYTTTITETTNLVANFEYILYTFCHYPVEATGGTANGKKIFITLGKNASGKYQILFCGKIAEQGVKFIISAFKRPKPIKGIVGVLSCGQRFVVLGIVKS